ncbi:hypothetical protein V8G54_006853, partial [Vigna mungo]
MVDDYRGLVNQMHQMHGLFNHVLWLMDQTHLDVWLLVWLDEMHRLFDLDQWLLDQVHRWLLDMDQLLDQKGNDLLLHPPPPTHPPRHLPSPTPSPPPPPPPTAPQQPC